MTRTDKKTIITELLIVNIDVYQIKQIKHTTLYFQWFQVAATDPANEYKIFLCIVN